jgi:hypothetical protein
VNVIVSRHLVDRLAANSVALDRTLETNDGTLQRQVQVRPEPERLFA